MTADRYLEQATGDLRGGRRRATGSRPGRQQNRRSGMIIPAAGCGMLSSLSVSDRPWPARRTPACPLRCWRNRVEGSRARSSSSARRPRGKVSVSTRTSRAISQGRVRRMRSRLWPASSMRVVWAGRSSLIVRCLLGRRSFRAHRLHGHVVPRAGFACCRSAGRSGRPRACGSAGKSSVTGRRRLGVRRIEQGRRGRRQLVDLAEVVAQRRQLVQHVAAQGVSSCTA